MVGMFTLVAIGSGARWAEPDTWYHGPTTLCPRSVHRWISSESLTCRIRQRHLPRISSFHEQSEFLNEKSHAHLFPAQRQIRTFLTQEMSGIWGIWNDMKWLKDSTNFYEVKLSKFWQTETCKKCRVSMPLQTCMNSVYLYQGYTA